MKLAGMYNSDQDSNRNLHIEKLSFCLEVMMDVIVFFSKIYHLHFLTYLLLQLLPSILSKHVFHFSLKVIEYQHFKVLSS